MIDTRPTSLRLLACSLLLCFASMAPPVQAQTITITYDLENVWLLPDITHPRSSALQMTGAFEWTYTPGDFENGAGLFLNYSIPWWGSTSVPLKVTVQPDAIDFTMIGNYHGLGLDVTLRMVPKLSPSQPSALDPVRSKFDIEVGISHKGHVISGRIVPRCVPPANYGSGTAGSGGFVPAISSSGGLPTIGNGAFQIDADQLLGGTGCLMLLGTAQSQFVVSGTTFLVDPSSWVTVPLQASGTPGVEAAGTVQLPLPIPNTPLIVGAEIHCQVAALDAGSAGGLASASAGLTIVFCR